MGPPTTFYRNCNFNHPYPVIFSGSLTTLQPLNWETQGIPLHFWEIILKLHPHQQKAPHKIKNSTVVASWKFPHIFRLSRWDNYGISLNLLQKNWDFSSPISWKKKLKMPEAKKSSHLLDEWRFGNAKKIHGFYLVLPAPSILLIVQKSG